MSRTLFISDIHLTHKDPKTAELLCKFLVLEAEKADALYILGDFFAIWFGDDVGAPVVDVIAPYMQKLATQIPIYFMVGNRDFLVGAKTLAKLGATQIADPTVIELYGKKILLTHGDRLCTLDKPYLRYRMVAQNSWFRALFLKLPKSIRTKIALSFSRQNSSKYKKYDKATGSKPWETYDTTETGISKFFSKYPSDIIVHGHTHTPKIISYTIQQQEKAVITLGEWFPTLGSYLSVEPDNITLESFSC